MAAIQAGRYLGWAVRFPKELIRQLVNRGPDARIRLRRSYRGQIADMLMVAIANGVMPRDYYAGNLARHGGDRKLLSYVPFHLYETVATQLSRDRSMESVAFSGDKRTFERRCRSVGLPVVRTIAVAHEDGFRDLAGAAVSGTLPATDLFLKPSSGGQGMGIERWRYAQNGRYAGPDGQSLSARDLARRCCQLCRPASSPVLVQECLENNAELRPIAGSALATTRLVTMINESGVPEIVEAFYRTSTKPDVAADNFHQGGLLFPIDIDTGEVRAGFGDKSYALPPIINHPETGSRMAGGLLPGWGAVSGLALRAHLSFRELLIVGWDIAHASDGPVLIEANIPPGISVRRQGASEVLVGTRLLALLAHHAGAWLENREPTGSRWRAAKTAF